MDYLAQINGIKEILKKSQYNSLSQELHDVHSSAGTAGEMLIIFCNKLIQVKYELPIAYDLIEEKSIWLNNYARSLGLKPAWKGKVI